MPRDGEKETTADWVEVPPDRLDPETLRRLLEEFVSRDGADWGEAGGSLDEKVDRVREQLRRRQVRIVFDLDSQTANLLPVEPGESGSGQTVGDGG